MKNICKLKSNLFPRSPNGESLSWSPFNLIILKMALFGACYLFFGSFVQAEELYFTNQSVRALGMGGAYSPIARGTDSMFYNPAALAFQHGIDWRIFNLNGGLNSDLIKANASGSGSTVSLANFYGKKVSFFAEGNSAIVVPYFGVAGYSDNHLTLLVNNPPYPNLDADFISDYGGIIGGAIPLGSMASIGMNIKQVHRWGGHNNLGIGTLLGGSTSLNTLKDSFANKGVGYGADLAAMIMVPGTIGTTVSAVWKDAGGTQFAKTDGADAPPRTVDNLSLGVASVLDLPGLDVTGVVEFTHLQQSSEQIGKKINLGAEISLPLIDVRAGIMQGYSTYGIGIDLFLMKLDLALYTVELGDYPGQLPDTRYQLGFTMDLGFDFNFNFLSIDTARKRKLKQRR